MNLKLCSLLVIVTLASSHVLNGRAPRQAVPPFDAWGLPPTSKIVPYRMANSLDGKERTDVLNALQFWSENTCIDFREAREDDSIVANITKSDMWNACYGPVGRDATQSTEVNAGCGIHTDTHEIGHLLGIHHTQYRSDRDKFIKVDQARLNAMNISSFNKRDDGLYGLPYDYGSIMHYSPRSGTPDPYFETTIPIYAHTAGSRVLPSFYDVLLVNIINICQDACHESTTKCENGGYMHPRDCSKCICPLGYTGRTCSELVIFDYCGGVFNVSDQWEGREISLNSQEKSMDVFNRTYCTWLLKAPPGKKVEIKVMDIRSNILCQTDYLCNVGFEFKIGVDPRLTGPRLCCPSQTTVMVSQLNTVPIVVIGGMIGSNPMNIMTTFGYRFVDGSTASTLPDDYGIPLLPLESTTSTEPASCTPPTDTEFDVTTDYPMDYSSTDEESTSSPCNNI